MIDESEIREKAYALWEKDACPDDADRFYWYLAQDQLKTSLQLSRGERARAAHDEQVCLVDEIAAIKEADAS